MTPLKPSILALPKYGDKAASMRQRVQQYIPYLVRAGYNLDIKPLLGNDYIDRINIADRTSLLAIGATYLSRAKALISARRYNAIWLHCETFPYLPAFAERLVFSAGCPVVLDFDDAIFHQYDCHHNGIIRRLLGKKLQPLMAGASVCAAGNAYLAQYAAQFCSDVRILPTVVDASLYRPALGRTEDAPVTIGWIGSPSTWAYVKPLVPLLSSLAQEQNLRVRVVGAGPQTHTPPHFEFLEWSEAEEIALIQTMDIGIMPLPDEPWARGKCGYKLIQYMACGLPVIASPVGVNSEIVEHGINGFLATTENEWRDAFKAMLADPEMRQRMGREGRKKVECNYSLQVHGPRLVRLMLDVIDQQQRI